MRGCPSAPSPPCPCLLSCSVAPSRLRVAPRTVSEPILIGCRRRTAPSRLRVAPRTVSEPILIGCRCRTAPMPDSALARPAVYHLCHCYSSCHCCRPFAARCPPIVAPF